MEEYVNDRISSNASQEFAELDGVISVGEDTPDEIVNNISCFCRVHGRKI